MALVPDQGPVQEFAGAAADPAFQAEDRLTIWHTARRAANVSRASGQLAGVFGIHNPDTLGSRGNLALAYQEVGRVAEAIPLHERTVADMERVLGPHHPYTLGSRANLANAYREAGQVAGAIPLLERTLADMERVLGPDHPYTLAARNSLANAFKEVDRGRVAPLTVAPVNSWVSPCRHLLLTTFRVGAENYATR